MKDWIPDQALPSDFIAVAERVYVDDPLWIPENGAALTALFGTGNSYFETAQAWVGCKPGKARLAGFYEPHQAADEEKTAFFGFWETIDDSACCGALFAECESWARAKGATRLLGPIDFCTHYNNRIRLDAFDRGAFFPGEPYNPPYYAELLEALGFTLHCPYYSWFGDGGTIVNNLQGIIGRVRTRAEENGLRFVPLTADYWLENLPRLWHETEEIFGEGLGFWQISYPDFERQFGPSLVAKIDPERSVLTLDADGNMAAFLLCFPDYAPLMRQGSEDRLSAGAITFKDHFPLLEAPLLLGKTVGVKPQFRRRGLFEIMCYLATEASLEAYQKVVVALIREGNLTARSARKVFSAPDCTTHSYGLFARTIASGGAK